MKQLIHFFIFLCAVLLAGCKSEDSLLGSPSWLHSASAIVITQKESNIPVGVEYLMKANAVLDNGSTVNVTSHSELRWSSSDENVALVTNKGVIKGLSKGEVTISVVGIKKDGSKLSSSVTLTITDAILTKLTLTPQNTRFAKGLTRSFKAMALYSDNSTLDVTEQPDILWTSSDTNIATVMTDSGSGKITGINTGNAIIQATSTSTGITGSFAVTITDASLSKLVVSPSIETLPKGLTRKFTAIAYFSDKTSLDVSNDPSIQWEVEDNKVMTVTPNGLVTGMNLGHSSVSATSDLHGDTVTGAANLTITEAIVTGLQLTPANSRLPKGLSQQYTATAFLSDNTTAVVTSEVDWVVDGPNGIASITTSQPSENGLLVGINEGEVVIKARGEFQGIPVSTETNLKVIAPEPDKLLITPTQITKAKGLSHQLSASVIFTDGSSVDVTADPLTNWSSKSDIVTVDSGLVKAEKIGLTEVLASGLYNGKALQSSVPFEVTAEEIIAIDVSPKGIAIAKGRTQSFTAEAKMTDGSIVDLTTDQNLNWSSSNESFALFDGVTNVVKGLDVGSVDIIASYNNLQSITNSTKLTITPEVLQSITVAPNPIEIEVGKSAILNAKGLYSDGTEQLISAQVDWTGQDTSIATVEKGGRVSGVSEGTTVTVASFEGISSEPLNVKISLELALKICGDKIDDNDLDNAKGACLKVTKDSLGNLFTSTPSIAAVKVAGFTVSNNNTNLGKTYADFVTESGTVGPVDGTFARFRQDGDGEGQFARWCNELNSIRFADRSNWRRPTFNELQTLYNTYANANQGLWGARGWPSSRYWTSDSVGAFYFPIRLYAPDSGGAIANADAANYASCISEL